MPLKRVNVRKHQRSKPGGGTTSVRKHTRNIRNTLGSRLMSTLRQRKYKHLNRESRLKKWKITFSSKNRTRWEHDDGQGWIDLSYDEHYKTWEVINQIDKNHYKTRNEAYTDAYSYRRDYGR